MPNCLYCKKENLKTLRQMMVLLPIQKLYVPCLPFTNICLDMAGPFRIMGMVKRRAKLIVWVMVYACMKYGAIFMNIAHKQDTAAFLMDWGGPHYVYDEEGSHCRELKV